MAKKTENKEKSILDFSSSTQLIKKAAKSINTQVRDVASEIAEDIKGNGSNLYNKAMTPVNKAYDKVAERVTFENLTETTKKANNYALKTAEEIVDGVLDSSEKWQNVAEKGINGGLKMAAKQQEMVFDTLETVKSQLGKSAKRLKKLVYNRPAKQTRKGKKDAQK